MKKTGNIFLASLLAVLLFFNGTMQEFVHTFSGHTDTIDVCANHGDKGTFQFENQHHHCSYLDFSLPNYINNAFAYIPEAKVTYSFQEHIFSATTPLFESVLLSPLLRGPPALS